MQTYDKPTRHDMRLLAKATTESYQYQVKLRQQAGNNADAAAAAFAKAVDAEKVSLAVMKKVWKEYQETKECPARGTYAPW